MRYVQWVLLIVTVSITWGQTPDALSLNGTWDFALGSDPAGLERLSHRNVWIESVPAGGFIAHVETATAFDDQFREADLKIRTLVAGSQGAPYELRAILTGPDGKEVQRTSLAVPAHRGTARDTLITMHLAAPLHWTAETPNLYRLNVEMVVNGAVAHSSAEGSRERLLDPVYLPIPCFWFEPEKSLEDEAVGSMQYTGRWPEWENGRLG